MIRQVILLSLLIKVPTCSTLDQNIEFTDGKDLTQTVEYKTYRTELEKFLTCLDSIKYKSDPIVPPGNGHLNYIEFDTSYDNVVEISIRTGENSYAKFRNSLNDHDYNRDSINFKFSAFDTKNNIIYMTERKRNDYLRLFGISLNTGNQFTVYENLNKSLYDRMFTWTFSPDFKYLLKTGDLEPNQIDGNIYGWSLVNLTDGSEGKVKYKRYKEFISNPQWIDNETFKYTLLEIPFKPGEIYTKDYRLYYALLYNEPLPDGIKMKYLKIIYPQVLTFNVKGYLISQNMYEYDTGLIY